MSSTLLRGQFVRMLAVAGFVFMGAATGRAAGCRGPRRHPHPPRLQRRARTVLATINGKPVTEADLELALADLDQQFARLPAEQRRAAAMSAIVEIRLLAEKATADGLDKSPDFQRRLEFLRQRTLHSARSRPMLPARSPMPRYALVTTRRWPTRRRSTRCVRVTSS